MASHRNYQWLRNLITGDEKCMLYINCTHRPQWPSASEIGAATPKSDLHLTKVMLKVWWGVNGIIHWEIPSSGSTMTADLCCQQLDRVAEKLKGNQDPINYLHDRVRPHIAKSTSEKSLRFRWIILPHTPYSPDLAPMDYHWFRSLSNHLPEKKFNDENDVKIDLTNFFGQKSQSIYERGILFLPER